MRLFGLGGSGEDEAAKERREQSVRLLEMGQLPLNAQERLKEQAGRQDTPAHCFTSDLSVNEALLVREAGYRPLGQVMGSSVFHTGWQWMPSTNWGSGELEVYTEAFYQARHRALSRLLQEAELLRATGVVGVRLEHQEHEWGQGMVEFKAIGTAIHEADVPTSAKHAGRPFLSDLSGQDFWLLRQAGFRPVGIAVGNCSYYQVPTWATRNATSGGFFGTSWWNQELSDYTAALYAARELAMERMEDEARAVNAEGIVGVDVQASVNPREIEVNNQKRIDMLYHFTAIGTAIAAYPAPPAKGLAVYGIVSAKSGGGQ